MLQSLLPGFLQWLRFEKRYSPHTIAGYERDLQQFSDFIAARYEGTDDIALIQHYHIRTWLAELKDQQQLAATTLNRKISTLNSFYKYLQRQGITEQNPVRKLHTLRVPERLPVYLKEQETSMLLEEQSFGEGFKGMTDRLICDLLYNTGMRRQELINIRETDVEWSLRQLRVLGKGNKERLIPLSEEMLAALRDYIGAKADVGNAVRDRLFVLESGKPLYPNYVYRVVTSNLRSVSSLQKKSPHVLRHTFATHLLNNGANIQAIKDLLGHSSLAATQVYTHNNIDKLKEIHKQAHPREQKGENTESFS